jgi:DNA segregation ATPase FtsK/SpoIIIE-like protein
MIQALKYAMSIVEARFTDMAHRHIKEWDGGDVYVIIDELADLMTTQRKQVQPLIQRIGQVGRAAHVHIIAATQCPLAVVIPTTIKVNFDSILGLRTATARHSRNIIDIKGCECFPDPKTEGRALGYYRQGANLTLYNMPRHTQEEINVILDYWRRCKPKTVWPWTKV